MNTILSEQAAVIHGQAYSRLLSHRTFLLRLQRTVERSMPGARIELTGPQPQGASSFAKGSITAPLFSNGVQIGVLRAMPPVGRKQFSAEDLGRLACMSELVSLTISYTERELRIRIEPRANLAN